MPRSTAIAPRTPSAAPALGGEGGVGADADDDQDHVGLPGHRAAISGGGLDLQPSRLALGAGDLPDRGAGQDLDAAVGELGVDELAERGVNGGQHLGELFHLDDVQAAGGEGVGHLQADVPRADDDRGGRCLFLEGAHDGERVAHRVQQVHAVIRAQRLQAADRGADRHRASTDDQLVVSKQLLMPAGAGDEELAASDVDPAGGGVQPQPHPGGFQVGGGAVGEVTPVGDLPGDVVGDAADREVRVGVRDDDADLGAGVELAGAQRGADPGVAAADHDQVHGWIPPGRAAQWDGSRPGRRSGVAGAPSWAARSCAAPAWLA